MKRSHQFFFYSVILIILCLFVHQSKAKDLSVAKELKKFQYYHVRGHRNLEDANYYDDGVNRGKYYVADDRENEGDDIVADDEVNDVDDNIADGAINDENNMEDDFYAAGDDNWLDSYSDDENDTYTDDEYTFNNRVKQKVIIYKDLAEEKFWEIYNNPPKNWTADQWGFFTALMTLLSFSIYCFCVVSFIPCCSRNRDDKEEALISTKKTNSSVTSHKQFFSRSNDENIDPIMYSRSYDSQVV